MKEMYSRSVIVFIVLFLINDYELIAQETLNGRWTSYSVTLGDKAVKIKNENDKIVLILKNNQEYQKSLYVFKRGSDSIRLSYHLLDGKIEDDKGKVLKRRKIKERGTYLVIGNEIVFFNGVNKDSVSYELQGGFLLLKENTSDADRCITKFKRGK
jgi:hypothetical protein